ncbi:MAG: GTPase Era [Alphaproteobacteria bacterium]|nr:GTPase Era [Alphaproteobacteria bacterium]
MKCGYIAILGATNAGKSTLLNTVAGRHAAIVSHKVQTTRFNIRAVKNIGKSQLIFIDTPGVFEAKNSFDRRMVSEAWTAMDSADAIVFLIDASKGLTPTFDRIVEKLKTLDKPISVALNKVDLVHKIKLLELAGKIFDAGIFEEVFMISALKNNGVEQMLNWAQTKLPTSPWVFKKNEATDLDLSTHLAELTREQVYGYLHKELPYMISVDTDEIETKGNLLVVSQTIYTTKPAHKQIIIGAKGEKLKTIGSKARASMESATGKKIHLELKVAVDSKWRE